MNHNQTVSGVNLGHLWGQMAVLREELQAVLALWDQGQINPHIDRSFPFAEAPQLTAASCGARTSARFCSCRELAHLDSTRPRGLGPAVSA